MSLSKTDDPVVSVEKTSEVFEAYQKFLGSAGIHLVGLNIADLGCAKGVFLNGLISANHCYGYDISAESVDECRRRTSPQTASFDVLDLNEAHLPAENRYHLITLFDVIEHLSSFTHLKRIIKDNLVTGGHLVVTTPNANSFVRLLGAARLFSGEADPTHTVLFTPYTLDFFLRRCGLVKVSLSTPYTFYFKNNIVTKSVLVGGQILAIYKKTS